MIGVASDTSSGKARLDLCIGTLKSHSNFIASFDRAEDYLRGWAVKWEGRIRELYDGPAPVPSKPHVID